MRYFVVTVPLLCAAGWALWTGPGHAADPATAVVWASSIAGFVYLARLAMAPNLGEQIDEAAGRLKDQLASAELLRKTIGALTASQQTAVENVKEVENRTKDILTELQRMRGETREAVTAVLAERDRAQKAEADAVAGLQEAYCTAWRLAAEPDASPILAQLATEFERLHLAKVSLSPINDAGVLVDYKLHEVVGGDQPTGAVAPGAVLRVVRPGFRRRGEVLGRAHVVRACALEAPAAAEPRPSGPPPGDGHGNLPPGNEASGAAPPEPLTTPPLRPIDVGDEA